MLDMKRREFIALASGGGLLLAVKVKRARAQQPAMPVIGFPQQRIAELLRAPCPRIPPKAKRPAAERVDGLIVRLPQTCDFARREKSD